MSMYVHGLTLLQAMGKELYIWSRLKHRNVLPIIGFTLDGNQKFPSLITEWMDNGTILDYLNKHPDVSNFEIVSTNVVMKYYP